MQFLTQKEVSALLEVSVKTITRLRIKGQLPTYYVGSRVRIPQEAVNLYMEKRKCRIHRNHQGWKKLETSTTFYGEEMENHKEKVYGQKIYEQQKIVSLGGCKNLKQTK